MTETTDTITRQVVDVGDDVGLDFSEPRRVMQPSEIKERLELNTKNTASAQRARVIAELAKTNGH